MTRDELFLARYFDRPVYFQGQTAKVVQLSFVSSPVEFALIEFVDKPKIYKRVGFDELSAEIKKEAA